MALLTNNITLFAVVRELEPGSGTWSLVAEQDNYPVVQELEDPQGGPWEWTVEGATHFALSDFELFPQGVGQKEIEIRWSGLNPEDYRIGESGTITIRGEDGDGNFTPNYDINIRLRSLDALDFTVFEGQTHSGIVPVSGVSSYPVGFYEFAASSPPAGKTISFSGDGRVSVSGTGSWDQVDEPFELSITHVQFPGSLPSVFDGSRSGFGFEQAGNSTPQIHLRRLIGDGYTVFENQTGSGPAASAPSGVSAVADGDMERPDVDMWTAMNGADISKDALAPYSGTRYLKVMGTGDTDPVARQVVLTIDKQYTVKGWARGDGANAPRVLVGGVEEWLGTSSATWQSFEFDITATASDIDFGFAGTMGWVDFDQISVCGAYDFQISNLAAGNTLDVDVMGRVANCAPASATWDETSDTTFDLAIADGFGPPSLYSGAQTRNLRFRKVMPERLLIPVTTAEGSSTINVNGHTDPIDETWFWWNMNASLYGPSVLALDGASEAGGDSPQVTADITWAAGATTPGDRGSVSLFIQRADNVAGVATVLSPYSQVPLSDVMFDIDVASAATGDHSLVQGRERTRYQTRLKAFIDPSVIVATDKVSIELDTSYNTSFTEIMAIEDDPGEQLESFLSTGKDTTPGSEQAYYIPDGTTPGRTVHVRAVFRDSADELLVEGDWVPVTIPIEETTDDLDVAILLDRSGSMRAMNRWTAALSGAQQFAKMVKAANAGGRTHRAGIYWFNGKYGVDNWEDGTSTTNYGTFDVPAGSLAIDFIDTITDAQLNTLDGDMDADKTATGFTAMGSGLLHCKNELSAGANDKIILMLSDGMENCAPLSNDIFFGASGTTAWGDPGIRLYTAALQTGSSWIAKLQSIVTDTGGLAALDVKDINHPTDYNAQVHHWFIRSFAGLFEFDEIIAPEDPTLGGGKSAKHKVVIHEGQRKAVFYMLINQPDSGWKLELETPSGTLISAADAESMDGVSYGESTMSKTFIVDLPLTSGSEEIWGGEWKMKVTRTGSRSGNYSFGALAKQDMLCRAEVLASARPLPGEDATLKVTLKDEQDNPITDALVKTTLRRPGAWPGNEVALEVGSNPKLVKKLAQSKSEENQDLGDVADRVLRDLFERERIEGGTATKYTLAHVGDGVYTKTVTLNNPGQHSFDTSIAGTLPPMGGQGTRPFALESREQLTVAFLPTVKDSAVGGYFVNGTKLRLLVQPAGKSAVMLGPGWRNRIVFEGPGGIPMSWPVVDAGDGHYYTDLEFGAKNPYLDQKKMAVVADKLWLDHPDKGKVFAVDNSLPLSGFSANVAGVRIPITIWSLVGNKRSKEVHLVTCSHVDKMADKNKVWMHDLKQAASHGYDTCAYCLPLICNSNPSGMEAHKLFCPFIKLINPRNRLEARSWSQAKKMGFDGCGHCLKEHHSR